MLIDANKKILGRMAAFAAKLALAGERVNVVNCERAVVTGKPAMTIARYKEKHERGGPKKGPFYQKRPDMFVRRTIRGMLPWKRYRGRQAFKRIRCYIGFPEELKKEPIFELPKNCNVSKIKKAKYISIDELCKQLKEKW